MVPAFIYFQVPYNIIHILKKSHYLEFNLELMGHRSIDDVETTTMMMDF